LFDQMNSRALPNATVAAICSDNAPDAASPGRRRTGAVGAGVSVRRGVVAVFRSELIR